ncbi:hypothetical protein [Stutzerimonas stutzeri]|uniref:Transcriptional regulator n=1 Tax=Stutzerimonas stutzeri TaxID=316 RepID=A0A6I6LSS9_STUST|nr:hypothetical protein [Stutzerimonas stutzeri]QGZ31466.1 hypothetical protein GQA94_15855 [Stutzerimonas stutzeri]
MSTLSRCEALANDPARYIFKMHLGSLKAATTYETQRSDAMRLTRHLGGLLECDVISCETHNALLDELHAFVWGEARP